jgi:hypothetical protein
MKANLPKKQKPPRLWERMSPIEREAINEYCEQKCQEQVNHEEAEIQKRLLQLACIVLHRQKDPYGKMRCLVFLKDMKREYNNLARFKTDEEIVAYLNKGTDVIFGKDGYPHEWVDKLEK